MSTFTNLPLASDSYFGGVDDDTMVAEGVRTTLTDTQFRKTYSYSYVVYNIATFGGADVVYISNVTGIDPAGVNPRAPQTIDLGAGNDFARVTSLTAATIFAGDGDDTIIKVDLRATSRNPIENGGGAYSGFIPPADGLSPDENWIDFNIVDGGAGNDIITMGNGRDWVYGGDGNDTISLGSGVNVAFAGDGADTIIVEGLSYTRVIGNLPPSSQTSYAESSNAIWAGDGDDAVSIRWVQNGADIVAAVNGEAGNDTITVLSIGLSWITGGDGADTVLVQADGLGYTYNTRYAQPSDALWGDGGDDVLNAELGDDTIVGGEGRDWIFGGYGNDFLYGGVGGGAADAETDRFSFGHFSHRDFTSVFLFPEVQDVDRVYDFQPQSRFANVTGAADVIDLAAMFNEKTDDPLTYGAANPFTNGQLRLVDSGGVDTLVEATDGAGGWTTFLILYGVQAGELDISQQADVSGGLAAKSGGDFLWFTG